MHFKKFYKSTIKKFIESTGILFSAALILATVVYAVTWAPGLAPQAPPGEGNVELSIATASLPKGYLQRSHFIYNSANSIKLTAAVYEVNGSQAEWNSELSYTFSTLADDDWSYLYIDESTISAGTPLTADNFYDSTTEPVWSDSKHGWYNGSDRSIFAVLANGGPSILSFIQESNFVMFDRSIRERSWEVGDTYVAQALTAPGFTTRVVVYFSMSGDGPGVYSHWRTPGTSGEHTVIWAGKRDGYYDEQSEMNTVDVITNAAQQIEVRFGLDRGHGMTLDTQGWYLPDGM